MNRRNQLNKENIGLVGALCGSLLVGWATISQKAIAAPLGKINPCPGIYYEEPFNSTNLVPQGCPANAATRSVVMPVVSPRPVLPPNNVVVPLPETRSNAIARVMPMNGTVDVRLKNNTNALISYQALGSTERRLLISGEEVVLQLPTPTTLTMVRQDDGLLTVTARSISKPGILEVSVDEAKTLNNKLGALRIQQDGQVFLN